jgi:hypothetical protein
MARSAPERPRVLPPLGFENADSAEPTPAAPASPAPESAAQPPPAPPAPEAPAPPPAEPWQERAARLEPEAEAAHRPDSDTPPRGLPATDRGWFDEYPEEDSVQFGPTGQPTELPYRYRP